MDNRKFNKKWKSISTAISIVHDRGRTYCPRIKKWGETDKDIYYLTEDDCLIVIEKVNIVQVSIIRTVDKTVYVNADNLKFFRNIGGGGEQQ